jgi:ribosomal protein S18 acetylase RimI-like enzyme
MNFKVRPARSDDFAALGKLTVEVYRDLLPPIKEVEAYLDEIGDVRNRAGETELLVAVDRTTEDVLGGISFVRPDSRHANVARSGEGEFRLLAVASAAQGRGVGEALVRACLDRAAELGMHGMALVTQPNMLAAHRLYRRLGFVRAPERDMEPIPGVVLWAFTTEFGPAEPGRA